MFHRKSLKWMIIAITTILYSHISYLAKYISYDDIYVRILCSYIHYIRLGFILGGFCVGFGTRLGNGCTTGHGICGLARLSTRSLVGVLTFMATGVLSATGCSKTCPFHPWLRDG